METEQQEESPAKAQLAKIVERVHGLPDEQRDAVFMLAMTLINVASTESEATARLALMLANCDVAVNGLAHAQGEVQRRLVVPDREIIKPH